MRMRRSPKAQAITQAQAETALTMFLGSCRIENLRALTADQILRSYRVPLKTAEYRLQIALQNRAGE